MLHRPDQPAQPAPAGDLGRVGPHLPRLPALDGVRGVGLAAVLLFHGLPGLVPGGFLGVTTFFVLSGFLITSLLLCERERSGRIDLVAFWGRRARRLVPAAMLCIGLAAAYARWGAGGTPRGFAGDAVASAFWVANWRFVVDGQTYADLFASPSPLQHMWSLAIEEQVYLVLPVLALLVLGWRAARPRRGALAAVLLVLAVGSAVAAHLLYNPFDNGQRSYYGTDTRAVEPLLGALLALVLVGPAGLRRPRGNAHLALDAGGVVAFGGLVGLYLCTHTYDSWLYTGGLPLAAALSAVVVAAASQHGTLVAGVLRAAPLRALGAVSYGAYLFHWPIFLWLSPRSTGLDEVPLFALRVAVTLAVATASYHLVEWPVRVWRPRPPLAVAGWANATLGAMAAVGLAVMLPAGALDPSGPRSFALDAAVAVPAPIIGAPDTTTATTAPAADRPRGPGAAASPRPQATAGGARTGAVRRTASRERAPNRLFEPPQEKPPTPPPAHAAPTALRIAVLGDSLGGDLGRALVRWAKGREAEVVVADFHAGGCSLPTGGVRRLPGGTLVDTSPTCGWWKDPASDRSKSLRAFDPHVVVVHDGTNASLDRKLPEWPRFYRPGEARFDLWTRSQYSEVLALAPRAHAVIANAVCIDAERWDSWGTEQAWSARVTAMNLSVYGAFLSSPGTTVADFHAELCPNGQYSDSVYGIPDARYDGVHLSNPAADEVVRRWLLPIVYESQPGRRMPA